MKRVKILKKWGIYELSEKERFEYGYNFAVIHPDVMGSGLVTPRETDMEMESFGGCILWIKNYTAS